MTEPLQPARIDFSDTAAPRAPDYDDVYHPRGGAFAQARHVFLAGNALPRRWAGRLHFVILETGFGLGHNFLATWAAWRDDPQRCAHLWYLSVDKHPVLPADLRRAHAHSEEPALARQLVDAWPPATPDLHRRDFADGAVHLVLAFGDVAIWLPQWVAAVDAIYLDGFAPAKNPAMWQPRLLRHLGRLARDGATAATWSSARAVRDALAAAGFDVQRAAGFDTKRDMLCAHHAPHHRSPAPAGRRFAAATGDVAIVGAGLAGAATARALATLGVRSTVFEARSAVAQGGSGQPAGLLHGVVHADDSPHARWFRAAALRAHATLAPLIAQQRVRGRLDGLLRVERELDHASMVAVLRSQRLPSDYVQALAADDASERTGWAIADPAWLFPGGGWVEPASLVSAWLDHPAIEVRLNAAVEWLEHDSRGRWLLRAAGGATLADSERMVLATAGDLGRLVADEPWPLLTSRGQVTLLPSQAEWLPALPVAGDGYAIALPPDHLLCGATSDVDDPAPDIRDADQLRNLASLQRLSGRPWSLDVQSLGGRVGWRVHTRDRLPLLGGVPLPQHERADAARQEQARFIARRPGLFVLAALGSRGLTHAALAGEVVASMIAGTPLPVGSAMLEAIDAARFAARATRSGLARPPEEA
ncbi:MAG TPA: FAD-dependent 5-carboxymethylaminomethyl-2-thiouridine(34) oxidoreductase MnmC [Burkholderiaceae bacterium]|nr:FAD-dependent 5-carboxymethylaminomethyl-2-thiouridine(34) oxidoreductase MnmC [Burkholderiaceae bacterium]